MRSFRPLENIIEVEGDVCKLDTDFEHCLGVWHRLVFFCYPLTDTRCLISYIRYQNFDRVVMDTRCNILFLKSDTGN